MTTLAKDEIRSYEIGDRNEIPMIASDIIYEGAAVGAVIATGHARPLTSLDKFVGFAEAQVVNTGAAAAKNVRLIKSGSVKLAITGAVITDINQPVYAQDDNAFSFIGTSGVFIGFMRRFVSAGYGIVEFNAGVLQDPHYGMVAATVSADVTLDETYSGKVLFVDTDAKTITLGALATVGILVRVVNAGAYGTTIVTISPDSGDGIGGPGLTSVDNKDLINTKATANRGDMVDLAYGDPTGWMVKRMIGTWAKE